MTPRDAAFWDIGPTDNVEDQVASLKTEFEAGIDATDALSAMAGAFVAGIKLATLDRASADRIVAHLGDHYERTNDVTLPTLEEFATGVAYRISAGLSRSMARHAEADGPVH